MSTIPTLNKSTTLGNHKSTQSLPPKPVEQYALINHTHEFNLNHSLLFNLEQNDHPQYLLRAGGTMTGGLFLLVDPTIATSAVHKKYVDDLVAFYNRRVVVDIDNDTSTTVVHGFSLDTDFEVDVNITDSLGEVIIPHNLIFVDGDTVTIEFLAAPGLGVKAVILG